MGPLMYKKPDWVFVYYHLEDEVGRCPRSHCRPQHPIVVRVNQGFVQIQHQDLPLHLG